MINFETLNKDSFLNELHLRTSIDLKILDNLFELCLINDIFEITEENKSSNLFFNTTTKTYFIPFSLTLKTNYQNSLQYIFASYPTINNDYHVPHKYLNKFHELFLFNNKDKDVMLSLSCFENGNVFFDILLEYDEYNNIPYDIDLLNDSEKQEFIDELEEQKYYFDAEIINSDGIRYYSLTINLYLDQSLPTIYLDINKQINNTIEKYRKHTQLLKEENKRFFERALLEIEMKEF